MKQLLFLLIALLMVQPTIAKDIELIRYSDLRLRDSKTTLYSTWHLGGEHSFPAGVSITIESDRISGSDGCNRFSASLMVASRALRVGSIMSTRAFCDELEGADQRFTQVLGTVAKYQFAESGELELLNGSGEVVLTLIP